jgi:hypothetical protein
MESIRNEFIKTFGLEETEAIENAAEGHKNGIHDKKGTDPFKWALLICIGHECMMIDSYRKYHGIKHPWEEIKSWIKNNAHLETHDGDYDFLAALCGKYNEYMPEKIEQK